MVAGGFIKKTHADQKLVGAWRGLWCAHVYVNYYWRVAPMSKKNIRTCME